MNLFLLGGIILKDKSVLKNRNWWFASIGALISSAGVAWYGDTASIIANFISLLLVSSFVMNRGNSVLIALLQGFCNAAVSPAYMIIDSIERSRRRKAERPGTGIFGKRLVIVLLAFLVALVFFFLYRSSNILFDKLAEKINFDFISLSWCFFTFIGALVIYSFYYHHSIPGVSEWESKFGTDLQQQKEESVLDRLMSVSSERFSGIVLLSFLNLLLLVVNGLDAAFYFGTDHMLPAGVTYTEYVHQGVGMLITSILLAMAIILYYFRGRLNFSANNGVLRALAVFWILQNAFMLFSTMARNGMYVEMFGLTYKRIGVYFYLGLTLIGLLTTAFKVLRRKTNAYLFRINAWLFYGVLVLSCVLDFDGIIAGFNTKKAVKPDIIYLSSLSFRAYPALLESYDRRHDMLLPAEARNKAFRFMSFYRRVTESGNWPSLVFTAKPVYENLYNRPSFGSLDYIEAGNAELKTIYYFPAFANTVSFNFANDDIETLGEIGQYRKLRKLVLPGNEALCSLDGIENLAELEELDITNTQVHDLAPLMKLTRLKKLACSGISPEWRAALAVRFPGIEINDYDYER
jgi:hypothetical protein